MDRFTVRLSSSHKPSGNTKPLVFKNPILTASGTFGYGVEFANYGDLTHLGGIVVKGLSLKPRPGNPLPRVAETPCGMLNAVGLQNDGVESFLKNKLPRLPWHETPVIANLYATSPAEFAELAGILAAEEGIAGLEVNISCPNVKNGGVLFGQDPALAAEVTQAVKKHAGNLPVIVKLSPNVTDITAIAKAAAPDRALDGEMQFDAAVSETVGQLKFPGSPVAGHANTFVFPDLQSGNIGAKIAQRFGGFELFGPLLQGLNAPINDLSRGCNAEEVYITSILTAAMA